MTSSPMDLYREAYDARCLQAQGAGATALCGAGFRGSVTTGATPDLQLLVEDDRALPRLTELAARPRTGTIRVLAPAARCEDHLGRDPGWVDSGPASAMVHPGLTAMTLPSDVAGLVVRPVLRGTATGHGVPLADTIDLVARATGRPRDREALTGHLAGLPDDITLLAAVDTEGEVRATGGSRTFGRFAYVFFVNTDPGWRRRGIGLAMTALALRGARDHGASAASLDASPAGARVYRRLGFVDAGLLTQHHRVS